jgi:hypothetical protein
MTCIDISNTLFDISTNEQFLPLDASKTASLVDLIVVGDNYDVDALYESLREKGVIPSMPARGASKEAFHEYLKADEAMRKSMEAGYKYYNARYKCAIETYIAAEEKPPIYGIQALSNRLFVLLSLYRKIDSSANVRDAMNAINSQKRLLEKMSNGTVEEKEMYMRMIEHTKEKARVTNNLMQLYGFLNIVALGMIFYIYRST